MAWYMLWLGGHDIVFGIALGARHGKWYDLTGKAWFMVYGIALRGMGLYMVWLGGMTCIWYGLAGMTWYMASWRSAYN